MHLFLRVAGVAFGLLVSVGGQAALGDLAAFQAAAVQGKTELRLPVYPLTPEEIKAQATQAMATADAALAKLAAQDGSRLTFATTFAACDAIVGGLTQASLVIATVAESSPEAAMRDVANEMNVKLQEWIVSLDYREDLYRVLKQVADARPKLSAEEQRLVDEFMRNYRRAGLALPAAERAEVEKLRKELAALTTEFAVNINAARAPLDFTVEELAGVPESFLSSPGIKQADGKYRVMANVTWHATAIAENAESAEVRRRVSLARLQLARDTNVPVLKKLIVLRANIAKRLGYATWADFQIETRMAKNGATAVKFEEALVTGLQPKFAAEQETLRKLKAAHTGKPDAVIESWDVAYYTNKLLKERYAVDGEKLRDFFPYQATLEGMFAIYQKIFGLKFTEVAPPYVWAPGVQLYVVQDSTTSTPMGAFYLDMFPRDGKFNHFACFPLKTGRVLAGGSYELPIAALLCNFPAPSADKPSLLKQNDVVTLFHEFGHVMHGMLSRSKFMMQGGFMVPQDFVEAPSQMLENWVWDKAVLDTFAADYRDPAKKIPAETVAALIAARQATEGFATRRQLTFGLIDLSMHSLSLEAAENYDVVAQSNAVFSRVSLAVPADTAFVAYFGHLAGYDAGYYGYQWAKVLAIDMASVFKNAPGGFLDEKVGRRLRDEVYAVGHTRDVGESVEKFLGRARSQQPYLDYVGIKK
ncbi:M3 family metallopeptidase [Oleiharenicola lentus]|uniref:M3 family metallopeptidase n=1 Tax=Oleiharenicola lentus TaxID=2508720 RepID=UPI003F6715D1